MQYRGFVLGGLVGLFGGGCDGCSSEGFHLDAAAVDAPTFGTVSLAWSLTDQNGQPIECEQVGSPTVSVQLRGRSQLGGVALSFSCAGSPGMSQAVPSGEYNAAFALNGAMAPLATAPDQFGVVIRAGEDTALSPVTFMVDATGSLALSFAAPPSRSNCQAPPNGAGITGTTITLVDRDGACAPVTFVRARGNTSLGTYTVNCGAPELTSCIETDETLRVPSLPSGPYTIHVRGKNGATDCWKNDNTLQVPAQGQAWTETLNLALQPGC